MNIKEEQGEIGIFNDENVNRMIENIKNNIFGEYIKEETRPGYETHQLKEANINKKIVLIESKHRSDDSVPVRRTRSFKIIHKHPGQGKLLENVKEKVNKLTKIKSTKQTHKKIKQIMFCDDCSFSTKRRYTMIRHQSIHTEVKPFSCKDCDRKFRLKYQMNRHELTHITDKGYKCLDPKRLKHASNKMHVCNICDYSSTKSYLKAHILTHSKLKPYECEQCDYKAKSPYVLNRHKLSHDPKNLLSCKLCEYQTPKTSSLKRHEVTHGGTTPFSCSRCDFSAKRLDVLRKHELKHDDENYVEKSAAFNRLKNKKKTKSVSKHRSKRKNNKTIMKKNYIATLDDDTMSDEITIDEKDIKKEIIDLINAC